MILIIDKLPESAEKFADTVYYLGIPTVATSYESFKIENIADFKAILVLNPESQDNIGAYISNLRRYSLSIPIFSIYDRGRCLYENLFDGCFKSGFLFSVFKEIENYFKENGLSSIYDYSFNGLCVSSKNSYSNYKNQKLNFTKTENMILRVLISTNRRYVSAKELLKLAFKKSRMPEASNIRAHISIMNKKFRQITGKNIIKTGELGQGYKLSIQEKVPALNS